MAISKDLENRLRAEWGQSAQRTQLAGQVVSVDATNNPDLVTAWFRVLTADIDLQDVMGRWINIPSGVLQAALPLFNPSVDTQQKVSYVPVKTNHDRDVEATAGRTLAAVWVEAGTIPAGVDARLELDRQLNGVAARGVERGILRSVSSAFAADWAPSHPDMNLEEFVVNYGEIVDGRRVGQVATRITSVWEISLVDQGADPYSRRIDASAPDEVAPIVTVEPMKTEDEDMTWKTLILESLGLASETDDEAVKAALAAKLAPQEPPAAAAAPVAEPPVVDAPVVAAQANVELAAAHNLYGESQVALTAARNELAAAKAELAQMKTSNILDEAVRLGKVTPAQRTSLQGWADRDLPGVTGYLATLAAGSAVPVGITQATPRAEDQTSELSSEIKALAAKYKVKPETLKKYLKD